MSALEISTERTLASLQKLVEEGASGYSDIQPHQMQPLARLVSISHSWTAHPDLLVSQYGMDLAIEALVEEWDNLGVPKGTYIEKFLYMVDNDINFSDKYKENCSVK